MSLGPTLRVEGWNNLTGCLKRPRLIPTRPSRRRIHCSLSLALSSSILRCDVSLRYVHGFSPGRPSDSGAGLLCTADNRLVYAVAAVVVVMDTRKHWLADEEAAASYPNETSQKYFQGHSSDVTALSLHPNKTFVASGQAGADPVLYVWTARRPTGALALCGGCSSRAR